MGRTVAWLSAVALLVSACAASENSYTPRSDSVDENSSSNSTVTESSDPCAKVNEASEKLLSEVSTAQERYDELQETFAEEQRQGYGHSRNDLIEADRLERQTLPQLALSIAYLIVDNPDCRSPDEVARARAFIDANS